MSTEKHKNHDTYFVPGLNRGLRVLEVLAEAERSMTVSEIGRALDISRSSAFRLIYTLNYTGFIVSADDGRTFQLGARVLGLGFSFLSSQSIIQTARPDLEALRDDTDISAHLAILESLDVLLLECVQSKSGFLSNVNVGARMPAHASPMGWLMLSEISDPDLAERYDGVAMKRLTERTPSNIGELKKAIDEATTKGVVISYGIVENGGCSISAPVRNNQGKVVAAIDISGPESAFEKEKMTTEYVPRVLQAARSISNRLGYANA